MKSMNIAYANLRAEMGRHNITIGKIATALDVTRETVSNKLSRRSKLNLDEAYRLRDTFFPGCEIEYLFEESCKQ